MLDSIKRTKLFKFLNFSSLSRENIQYVIKCENLKVTTPQTDMQTFVRNVITNNDLPLEQSMMFLDTSSTTRVVGSYLDNLICALFIITRFQTDGGLSIIKMSYLTQQTELDFVYILNYLFDKVYILKPDSSNATEDDKYIVCKQFSQKRSTNLIDSVTKCVSSLLSKDDDHHIQSLLATKLPYTFTIKIEEINAIIGQKQLDGFCQTINAIKCKSNDDKISTICKANVYKCIQWCETHRVPHNKIFEKNNTFNQSPFKNTFKTDLETPSTNASFSL